MPTYEYQCDACQIKFETSQSIHDDPLVDCLQCKEPKLQRLISGVGIIFKGAGFYSNDKKTPAAKNKSPEAKNEVKSEVSEKKNEAKSEAKSEAKPAKKSEAPAAG